MKCVVVNRKNSLVVGLIGIDKIVVNVRGVALTHDQNC
jgi:hypothetical protein